MLLVVCNFNPVLRKDYKMGAPNAGTYKEILNSDDVRFGGSGVTNGSVKSEKGEMHGFEQHISLTLPPMSTMYFQVPAARKHRAEKAAATEKPAAKKAKITTAKAAPKRSRTKTAKTPAK